MTWVDVTITEVVQETPLDRTFVLSLADGRHGGFAFVPGQHLKLRDPAAQPPRDWYFSLSGAMNDAGTLRVTVRGRGAAVTPIYEARVGTAWQVQPPGGTFHVTAPAGERVVLAAAGSGITPFRAFVEHRAARGSEDPVWLLQSARRSEELLFHEELTRWAAARAALTYVPTVTGHESGWTGRRGRIDADLLAQALDGGEPARVYACGPRAFVDAIHELAEALGVPAARRLREPW